MDIVVESLNDSETISVDNQIEYDFEGLVIANNDTAWHFVRYYSELDQIGQETLFRVFRYLINWDPADKEFEKMYRDMHSLYYSDIDTKIPRNPGMLLGEYAAVAEKLAWRYREVYQPEKIMKMCYKVLCSFNLWPSRVLMQKECLCELITELLGLDYHYEMSETVWRSLSKYNAYGALTHIYEVIKILGLPN